MSDTHGHMYYSGGEWPEPSEVYNQRTEEFLRKLTALTTEYGLAVEWDDESLLFHPFGPAAKITSFIDSTKTRVLNWEDAQLPSGFLWDEEHKVYLTCEEKATLERLGLRK